VAADRITRITHDEFWYGDPQWAPDGSFLVVHANRTADRESVRFTNVNRNFDLWKITLSDHRMEQLTSGPGPEFSPRISPDGTRLACLSSPRRGPHMDVFNLMIVGLSGDAIGSRVVFDHHGPGAEVPPSLPPTHPLPEHCWRDANHLVYNAFRGVKPESQCLNVDSGPGVVVDPGARPPFRSPLLPVDNPTLNSRLRARDEIIRWKTFDGLEIEGVLTTPPDSLAQKPHKLLVIPHGGPHSRSSLGSNFEVQIFAANGFAVFQPNFRGSSGYGLGFLDADRLDYGGGDMRDILSGIDALIEKGVVDRNRQFVFGASYGGFMAAWLVGHTTQFRAAVALNAVTDLNAMWHLSDVQSWTEWGMGGLPWEVSKRMRDHSPLTHVARVRTPTLILHSLNDRRCPVAMGHMFHQALKRCGVETQMVLYPEEGHGLKQLPHREDLLMRTLEWFTQHDVPASNSRTSPREP
jgi:acetyl esterase/lipase